LRLSVEYDEQSPCQMFNRPADVENLLYTIMNKIYLPPRVRIDNYGKPIISAKAPEDFIHLLGMNVNDIILFDDGTDDLVEQGAVILPRQYFIFIGNKDGELQFKPYEFNQYRIVVTTHTNIITSIDSLS
jgi:hypothetical protein